MVELTFHIIKMPGSISFCSNVLGLPKELVVQYDCFYLRCICILEKDKRWPSWTLSRNKTHIKYVYHWPESNQTAMLLGHYFGKMLSIINEGLSLNLVYLLLVVLDYNLPFLLRPPCLLFILLYSEQLHAVEPLFCLKKKEN